MIRIENETNLEQIYNYQMSYNCPYFFDMDFNAWKSSFEEDVDGEGRTLFKELFVKAAYDEEKFIGFIQYGRTAFGFDEQGNISDKISYCVIRNLYFDKDRMDVGELLLKEAQEIFAGDDKVYAFFHYFGMSCFARHGKIFEKYEYIEELLKENRFEIEHENVYYSSVLKGDEESEASVKAHDMTKGNQQYLDLMLMDEQVGGCELHFVDDNTAYLRWIYINENSTGKGIGTKCMVALKQWLYKQGIKRFDTDTAINNDVARHYYEKNNFTYEGITRSYYK